MTDLNFEEAIEHIENSLDAGSNNTDEQDAEVVKRTAALYITAAMQAAAIFSNDTVSKGFQAMDAMFSTYLLDELQKLGWKGFNANA